MLFKSLLKKRVFPRKLYNINYKVFETLFKIFNGAYKVNKVFFKILNFSATLYHMISQHKENK